MPVPTTMPFTIVAAILIFLWPAGLNAHAMQRTLTSQFGCNHSKNTIAKFLANLREILYNWFIFEQTLFTLEGKIQVSSHILLIV